MKIILASSSPRRKDILGLLGIPFTVRLIQGLDESFPKDLIPEEVPLFLAKKKSEAYVIKSDEILITADTVVAVDSKILGKPHDLIEAKETLKILSNKTHQVITGVCLRGYSTGYSFSAITDVTFKELTKEEINFYVEKYKPFDKAGSYGIQEWIGAIGVKEIKGSYFNVMGLPIHQLYEYLLKIEGFKDFMRDYSQKM